MGGLRKKFPRLFITFLIGGASLSALPLITAGFYSKDQILWLSWASPLGNQWLWIAAVIGAFVTSLYTFRMIFMTFFGELKTSPVHPPGWHMGIPLIILAFLSFAGGFIEFPENLVPIHVFSAFIHKTLPALSVHSEGIPEWAFQFISGALSITGIVVAYGIFYKNSAFSNKFSRSILTNFFYSGWGFDKLYDTLLVRPYVWLSEWNKNDFIDKFYDAVAYTTVLFNRIMSTTQNGKLRWYVMGFTAGLILLLTIIITL
jgi:NADH-quinone oxidoreductase subunit L